MKIPKDMQAGTIHPTNGSGDLMVTNYLGCSNVEVTFVNTGFSKTTQSINIRKGEVRDNLIPSIHGVGFLGEGDYSAYVKNTPNENYKAWKSMLQRCYSPNSLKKFPTYKGCAVTPAWFNFQVFAEWYEANYPKDGKQYDLDKDIKVEGNKLYSPDTCLFVSPSENTQKARAKHFSFISPTGEVVPVYNLSKFCRENELDTSHMHSVSSGSREHHKGWRCNEIL